MTANQSRRAPLVPPSEEPHLQNHFMEELKRSQKSQEERTIADDYLFKKIDGEERAGGRDQPVQPFDAQAQRVDQNKSLRSSQRILQDEQSRQSHRAEGGRDREGPAQAERMSNQSRKYEAAGSQNFGAMQDQSDRMKLEEFMNGNNSSFSKGQGRSPAEEVEVHQESFANEFTAGKRSRGGSRAESRGQAEDRRSQGQSEREEAVRGTDQIVSEKRPRQDGFSARKNSRSGSRGRMSGNHDYNNDSKLYERGNSMSSIGKGSHHTRDPIPFVDDKLSNVNDTRMSNALQPRRQNDNLNN